jgi:hypothetical protein
MTQSERMPKPQLKWIVTANFTADGAVAYLVPGGGWSGRISDVVVFESKDDAEAARKPALKAEATVSDPYLMEASDAGAALDVLTTRERIRALGPSVPYGRNVHEAQPVNPLNKVYPAHKPATV